MLSYIKRNNDEEEHSIGLSGGKGGCLARGTIFIFAYHLIVFYFYICNLSKLSSRMIFNKESYSSEQLVLVCAHH